MRELLSSARREQSPGLLQFASRGIALAHAKLRPLRELSDDVKRLLVALGSVEALEALLLLARAPEKTFSYGQIAAELHVTRGVEAALEHLASLNLADVRLASTVRYCYAPTTPALAATVTELAREYDERRLLVLDSLRATSPMTAFADAFRFTRKPPPEPPAEKKVRSDSTPSGIAKRDGKGRKSDG